MRNKTSFMQASRRELYKPPVSLLSFTQISSFHSPDNYS